MPILLASRIEACDQEHFHQIDRRVTGLAYDIQNEFGRFLTEDLYHCELARRSLAARFDVVTEFQMTAAFDDFRKDYFADLLIDRCVLFEVKTVERIGAGHKGQLLNYLFLSGLHHGSILNFRPASVRREFVSTSLTSLDRSRFELLESNWKAITPACRHLRSCLLRMLEEWGAFLDPVLYRDAATHFFGGEARVVRDVEVFSGERQIGVQPMRLLDDSVAFSITAATQEPDSILKNLQLLLNHTKLRAIQWINLNHHRIEFQTIENR